MEKPIDDEIKALDYKKLGISLIYSGVIKSLDVHGARKC